MLIKAVWIQLGKKMKKGKKNCSKWSPSSAFRWPTSYSDAALYLIDDYGLVQSLDGQFVLGKQILHMVAWGVAVPERKCSQFINWVGLAHQNFKWL